ncbi:MAG: hypothetical protein COA59_01665 [Colwellia sp.]|nr:MAG: hypothetical protein COA59_01665 [Colwellia sp.]
MMRERGKHNQKHTIANDNKARSDIHARHSEYYLLLIFALSVGIYYLPVTAEEIFSSLPYGLSIALAFISKTLFLLLIIESIMWMFYYMLLRVLIEKHLSIYNEAEYFIVLPFVLLTQCFLLASHLNIDMTEVFSLLINISYENGLADNKTKLLIGALGYTYTVLIIANVINLIPPVPVQRKANVTIIGAGDVVQKRLLPALLANGLYKENQIAIASDIIDSDFKKELDKKKIAYHEVYKKIPSTNTSHGNTEPDSEITTDPNNTLKSIINFIKTRSSYVLIATPADEHFPYMKALTELNISFGVEKPIVATQAELDALTLSGDNMMKNGFLLSYYWLEKALPLNYFFTLNSHYREFLDISFDNKKNVTASNLAYIKNQLGTMQGISIKLLEGIDKRAWSLMKENGGFYFETLIHPITLLHNILPTKIDHSALNFSWFLDESIAEQLNVEQADLGASYVEIKGKISGVNIDIRTGKYIENKTRFIKVSFTNGSIIMNLDTLCCQIDFLENNITHSTSICVKNKFGGKQTPAGSDDVSSVAHQDSLLHDKYLVQMNLFDLFVKNSGHWQSPQRFDDYPNQLKIIKDMSSWLTETDNETHFYRPKVVPKKVYQSLPNR